MSSDSFQSRHGTGTRPNIVRVKFWEGLEADIDVEEAASRSISVKGSSFENPLRFLEIYSDGVDSGDVRSQFASNSRFASMLNALGYEDVKRRFFPKLPWQPVEIGAGINLPPFCWKDGDARKLCASFTYNANAFYRILKNLGAEGKIPESQIGNLLDQACLMLAQIYKADRFRVIRHINNNFNMYLISRVIEELVGREVYCSEEQELTLTTQSLSMALKMAPAFAAYSVEEKMGFAVGMGVTFMEQRIRNRETGKQTIENTEKVAYEYYGRSIAIDDRARLLRMVSEAGSSKSPLTVAAILDDATETVIDLLWMQDLIEQYPYFCVNLLVNTAQISINFSRHMLEAVLSCPSFTGLASHLGNQFRVTEMFCPFISFETSYLPPNARRVIDSADIVYIKGANFFETCQISEKVSFHAFVVFGPVSRAYSGLADYEAVFAYLPPGIAGYIHHPIAEEIVTLKQIVRNRDGNPVLLP